jgi:flagellum-specific ATP synthase
VSFLSPVISRVASIDPVQVTGTVASLRGLTLMVDDLPARVGTIVDVHTGHSFRPGEVVGFDGRQAIVMMLGQTSGIRAGDHVATRESSPTVSVGQSMLGRVINALGQPVDGGPTLRDLAARPLNPPPLAAMDRRPISQPLPTGVRVIDLMTTVGRGQRVGVFAGPGVGKSILLGMMAKRTTADVNVIAMIGERGREVREFIEHVLGEEGRSRTVVVVSTSDESPLLRVRAAMTACAVAEHFRDQGKDVLLMMDSVTRLAHAQRQIGLAVGEPPASKGYTPSVFSLLPMILERAGAVDRGPASHGGSITGFYTVLVEGDDMTEPVADAVRGILDGHIILSRTLAHRGHYPAVDILESVSRLANAITTKEHAAARQKIVQLAAAYKEAEELIQIGAYAGGSNPLVDTAIRLRTRIDALLCQTAAETDTFEVARDKLVALARDADGAPAAPQPRPAQPASAKRAKQ